MLDSFAMTNFGQLTHTVQENCDVSDAQYAGHYSLCTFLLKMREYYRWENEIQLSSTLAKDEVGTWLAQREHYWEHISEKSLRPLLIEGQQIDPFDTRAANRALLPHGYVYSGGYGLFRKPSFFLATLARKETHDGVDVYIASCEYARDLAAPPAMALGETIFVRQECIRRFVWEKIEEWRWKKNHNAPLAKSVACYPATREVEQTLERMTDNETRTTVLHELGEVKAGRLLGAAWEELLDTVKRPKTEFLVRAVRDHLADCLLTLPVLIAHDNRAALHFYFANFTGLRREIFPEALHAYQRWANNGNPQELTELCNRGGEHWLATAHVLLKLFFDARTDLETKIEALFATPSGGIVSCAL